MMLNALTTLLETEDYTSITAIDGESGIALYREQHPDAVLLDLRLPAKTGIEVLKEIRRINAQAKVIIITGFPSPEVREESMKNGAFAFYEKSKDIGELLQALQKAFETSAS